MTDEQTPPPQWPDRAPRKWTSEEQIALLEYTRHWADKKIKEERKAGRLPLASSTIYYWRQQHWGTMRTGGEPSHKNGQPRKTKRRKRSGPPRTPEEKAAMAETQAAIVADYKKSGELPAILAARYKVAASTVANWLERAGLRKKLPRRGDRRASQPSKPVAAELLLTNDQEARAEVQATRIVRSEVLQELEALRLENTVLKANLGLAIRNGYLSMFDLESMFTRRKGR